MKKVCGVWWAQCYHVLRQRSLDTTIATTSPTPAVPLIHTTSHTLIRNSLIDPKKQIQPNNGSFINKYLNGKLNKSHPDILCGKTCYDLPVKEVHKLSNKLVTASTGPGGGLTCVNRRTKAFDLSDADVDFIDEDYNETNNSLPFLKNDNINGIISKCIENDDKNKHNNNNEENWEQKSPIISSETENIHKSATIALG
ncbi:unnamed protein product, partial [Medioppia subpectinata]